MTKINDVEANLEQFKLETLASQEETRNLFNQMQESIDKNKADSDRQFAELLQLLKALQPSTTLPATILRFEENSGQCFSSDEVEKEELILMSMDKDDVTGPILVVKEDLEQKIIDDLDEPLIELESYGMKNKNEFADGDVAPVAVVAPIAAIAPVVAPLEATIILKLGYEICLGHLLTNVRLKQEPVPDSRRYMGILDLLTGTSKATPEGQGVFGAGPVRTQQPTTLSQAMDLTMLIDESRTGGTGDPRGGTVPKPVSTRIGGGGIPQPLGGAKTLQLLFIPEGDEGGAEDDQEDEEHFHLDSVEVSAHSVAWSGHPEIGDNWQTRDGGISRQWDVGKVLWDLPKGEVPVNGIEDSPMTLDGTSG
ncbi:hypothetical protein Tco_0312014 [Tanacetum coccineum]